MGAGRRLAHLLEILQSEIRQWHPTKYKGFYVTLDTADLRYRNITEEMPNAIV